MEPCRCSLSEEGVRVVYRNKIFTIRNIRPHDLTRKVVFVIQFPNYFSVWDSVKWFCQIATNKNTAPINIDVVPKEFRDGD